MNDVLPKFSIVIPLYNKEKDIENTLDSVFNQTLSDYEIIIVNDGSTDASEQIVSSLKDPRIKLITKKNEGVSGFYSKLIDEGVALPKDKSAYSQLTQSLALELLFLGSSIMLILLSLFFYIKWGR